MNIKYLIEHDLGQAQNLERVTRDENLRLERWVDLTQLYVGYRGAYRKRTYLWKVEVRERSGDSIP